MPQVSVMALCRHVGMSRQNYYREKKARRRKQVDEGLIVELVKGIRKSHKKMGVRKLYNLLKPELESAGVSIGRDRFFEVMRSHGLLIKRRSRGPRTTYSRHDFDTYENQLKDLQLDVPHQAWVCDLTYIRTDEGFMYLSLITDAYSRKVVGYHIGDSLEVAGCLKALRQALRQLPAGRSPVHHSDRGTQYCCKEYILKLKKHGVKISMTEENHCYENAKAERMNGILKDEYGLSLTFKTKLDAVRATKQGVWLYNEERPHTSLGYRIPSAIHREAA